MDPNYLSGQNQAFNPPVVHRSQGHGRKDRWIHLMASHRTQSLYSLITIIRVIQAIFRAGSSSITVFNVARTVPHVGRTRLSDLGKSFVYSRSVSGGDLKVVEIELR